MDAAAAAAAASSCFSIIQSRLQERSRLREYARFRINPDLLLRAQIEGELILIPGICTVTKVPGVLRFQT